MRLECPCIQCTILSVIQSTKQLINHPTCRHNFKKVNAHHNCYEIMQMYMFGKQFTQLHGIGMDGIPMHVFCNC